MEFLNRRLLRKWISRPGASFASSRPVYRRLAFICLGTSAAAFATAGVALAESPHRAEDYTAPTVPIVPHHAPTDADLPVIALEDVRAHCTEASVWVTYEGYVYDVTPFVTGHPGGKELLLSCAGLDLHQFFRHYPIHGKSAKAADYLAGMRIGRLSAKDAERARESTTTEVHIEKRLKVLSNARWRFFAVLAMVPLMMLLRVVVQLGGIFLPTAAHWLADRLPVSVPGYGMARPIAARDGDGRATRVAVIGGGIAGSGCAYALQQSGYDVSVYEARSTLGGNARTFNWIYNDSGDSVTSCVAVTAWPKRLFNNYIALLKSLDVQTAPIEISFLLNSTVPGKEGYLWTPDPSTPEGSLRLRLKDDFDRYNAVLRFVKSVSDVFSMTSGQEPSLYSGVAGLGLLNPLNVIPLRTLCRWWGVSDEWWEVVFTPLYTSSFLTDKLDNLVAVVAPLVEEIIPVTPTADNCHAGHHFTTCDTWADGGDGIKEVFRKLTADCQVHLDSRVLKVRQLANGKLEVLDDRGNYQTYDRVVFACPCNAVGNIHEGHNFVEDAILATPEYADDKNPTAGHMHAVMHHDASIIPEEYRDGMLQRGGNYVETTRMKDGTLNYENTYNFSISTPSMRKLDPAKKRPLLITHDFGEGKGAEPNLTAGNWTHARAHPLYSGWNMATMLSLRLAQGRGGVYYCGNYTTPGNGHDMSLSSGFNVAHSIGAAYPFEGNVAATRDFYRLRTLMGL